MSEFEKLFNELSRTNDRSIIWNNWLDYCININLMQTTSKYAPRDFYNNEETYFLMFVEWINELNNKLQNESYYDLIGTLYEENVQSKGKAKDFQQYFTPASVTELLSDLIIDEQKEYDKPFMSDPCCGSGRFMLAAHTRSQGKLICIGQDLDETACKMAVLNLYSHGVRGSVLHMNTLEGTFYKGWRVNRYLLHGIPVPHIEEIHNVSEAHDFLGVKYNGNEDNVLVVDSPTVDNKSKVTTSTKQSTLI